MVGDPLVPGSARGRSPARASPSRTCTPSPATGSAPATRPGSAGGRRRARARRRRSSGCSTPAPTCADRPHRRVRLLAWPAPTPTTARRPTRGPRAGSPAARRRARPARSRWATPPSGWAPTPAARSGCRRPTRASGASAPPTARCRATGCCRWRRSFDTVGWLTRDADLLRAGRRRAAPGRGSAGQRPSWSSVPALLALAEPDVAAAVGGVRRASVGATAEAWDLRRPAGLARGVPALQAWEAWQEHGDWLADAARHARAPTYAAGSRRPRGSPTRRPSAARGRVVARRATAIRDLVGDRVLVLPSASSVAPPVGPGWPSTAAVRDATHAADLPGRARRAAGGQRPAHHRAAGLPVRRLPGRRRRAATATCCLADGLAGD